jgi:molecular chaperone HscB
MADAAPLAADTLAHFDRLGLPRRFALDAQELERQYLSQSREVHPDFHGLDSQVQQRASLEQSAALNEAYRILREPFLRAEYLLRLEGGPSASEYKEMEPAFLEEMLELRMEIEDLRDAGNPESPAMAEMERKLTQRRTKLIDDLACRFAHAESQSTTPTDRRAGLLEIRKTLNAAKYVQGLLRDLHAD